MAEFIRKRKGLITGASLVVIGMVLQALLGPLELKPVSQPEHNLYRLSYLLVIILPILIRRISPVAKWLSSIDSATGSIAWALGMTLILGLVRQSSADLSYGMHSGFPGFRAMLSNWSFLLVYAWLMFSALFAVERVAFPLTLKGLPFFFNHVGLFWALFAGMISCAESRSYRITLAEGEKSSHFISNQGNVEFLPLTIELKDFDVSFYDEGYSEMESFAIPKQFVSTIRVSLPYGPDRDFQVRVNHPARMDQWHIYQYGYDAETESSTFLIISDRWRPMVGIGLIMMLAGAVCLFIQTSRRKERQ